MHTTKKQESKARKSRGAEMLCDIENKRIKLGANHLKERKASLANQLEGLKARATMIW